MSFKLSLKNKKLNEQPDVKKWLSECEKKINEEITEESLSKLRSYIDSGIFGTSIIFVSTK